MTEADIRRAIDGATKLVASWPAWKQNALADSARPMFDRPRPPVIND